MDVNLNAAQAKIIYDLAYEKWSNLASQPLTKDVDKELTHLEDILNLFYVENEGEENQD